MYYLSKFSRGFFLSISVLLFFHTQVALAQKPTGMSGQKQLDVERQKLRVEWNKVAIERRKLQEQSRATLLTMGTILVTAAIGFSTIFYNALNTRKQLNLQAKLKALEVVVSASGPNSAKERLRVVRQILGKDWIDANAETSPTFDGVGVGHTQNRKDLIEMLLKYPNQRKEVFEYWSIAFKDTKLEQDIKKMEALKTSRSVNDSANSQQSDVSSQSKQ